MQPILHHFYSGHWSRLPIQAAWWQLPIAVAVLPQLQSCHFPQPCVFLCVPAGT